MSYVIITALQTVAKKYSSFFFLPGDFYSSCQIFSLIVLAGKNTTLPDDEGTKTAQDKNFDLLRR